MTTNEAAVRLKPTNFTIEQTKLQHKKANEVETQKIELRGLITTSKGALKQTKTYHIEGKFWWNKEINNIPTLKRIDERNDWFNRHRQTRELNVYYQFIKPPINKTIGKIFKRENANAPFTRCRVIWAYGSQWTTRVYFETPSLITNMHLARN